MGRHPVLMLLIGSDEAMMDRLFEHDRPLFGRLDDQLVVRPFNPAETAIALGGGVDATAVLYTCSAPGTTGCRQRWAR